MESRTNEAKYTPSTRRYQILVQREGKRRCFVSSICEEGDTKRKIEAERKADLWIATGNRKDIKLGPAYAAFIEDRKKQSQSSSDWKKHDSVGNTWLLPALKYKRLSKITNQDWQDIINEAYGKGRSKKTLMSIRASITRFYRFCKKGKYPMEPPEDIDIPRDAPVRERKILQPEQLNILFADDSIIHYTKPQRCHFIHAWRFEVLTGLRPGEIAGLERSKDINESLLQIKRSINQFLETTRGKNDNARRNMVLTRQALDVLEDQATMLKEEGIVSRWVFPGEDGDIMDTKKSYKQWLTYRKQHGIYSSLYELRHSMISYSKEIPEQLLKRVVGHGKSMDTFGVYGHDVDGELQKTASLLEQVFDRLMGKTEGACIQ